MTSRLVLPRLLPLLAVGALAACGDSTASSSNRMALSFGARGELAAAPGAASGGIVVSGTDTLHITSARLVLDKLELEQQGATNDVCADDSATVDDCAELEIGPYLVNLPLANVLSAPVSVSVPAGTYSQMEMKLRPAESGTAQAFLAAHPELSGISVVVEGTYHGTPFVYREKIEAELELDFVPALALDGNTGITVNIDLSRWFRTSTGAIIDPATAATGQPNFEIVAANIRASFEVFEDDDHDGMDDGASHS